MGGKDDKSNIVKLTPEEHYVAHQLLVKIYPHIKGLIYAANIMSSRVNNKSYGWIRRKISEAKTGVPREKEHIEKMVITRIKNGNYISYNKGIATPIEQVRKGVETRKANGSYINMGKNLIGRVIAKDEISKRLETRKITYPNHSDETRQKISEGNKGKTNSLETRKKISDANKGKKVSDEVRLKISNSMKGIKRVCRGGMSEDHKLKISQGNIGKPKSESARLNMSKAMKGRVSNQKGKFWKINPQTGKREYFER